MPELPQAHRSLPKNPILKKKRRTQKKFTSILKTMMIYPLLLNQLEVPVAKLLNSMTSMLTSTKKKTQSLESQRALIKMKKSKTLKSKSKSFRRKFTPWNPTWSLKRVSNYMKRQQCAKKWLKPYRGWTWSSKRVDWTIEMRSPGLMKTSKTQKDSWKPTSELN